MPVNWEKLKETDPEAYKECHRKIGVVLVSTSQLVVEDFKYSNCGVQPTWS